MKKTLIAMAAVAVAGVASAQVTITGAVAAGYSMTTKLNAASVGGYGFDGSSISFKATEDLGGGLSVTATSSIDGIMYGSGTNANTASLTVAGGFGSIAMVAAKESCDGLSGNAQGVRLDGAGFVCGGGASDALVYTFPEIAPGLAAKVTFGDNLNGFDSRLKATTWEAKYTAGAVMVGGNITKYEKAAAGDKSNKTRIFASYDMGVAKLGIGSQSGYAGPGEKDDRTVFGISIPMGALTIAAGSGTIDETVGTDDTNKTSTGVNLTYALSKRTSVVGDFTRTSGAAAGDEKAFNRVLVKHSF